MEAIKIIFKLDLKLLWYSRPVMASLLCSAVLFFCMAQGLAGQAEERSSIPVGMVDEDGTASSRQLLKQLGASEALFVYERPKKELEQMLRKEMVAVIFTIKKGFEEELRQGSPDQVLLMQTLSGNSIAPIVADVVAGEMMYEVCLGKGEEEYQSLGDRYSLVSGKEYRDYADQIRGGDEFTHGFRIRMEDPASAAAKEREGAALSNQLLYQQVIVGMLGIVMSFLALFLVGDLWTGKEDPAAQRLMLTGMKKQAIWLGHGGFIALALLAYCLAGTLFLAANTGIGGFGNLLSLFLMQWAAGLSYLLLFAAVKAALKGSSLYPLLGGIFVVLGGGVGIMGLFWPDLLKISKFIPNYWCIETFTAIIKNEMG